MQQITLKKLLNHKNKTVYILLLTGVFLALYSASGAISVQNAGMLPIPQFESDIPFMPWTIWVYIVFYPIYLIWALYSFKEEEQMNKTMYGFVILTIISCFIFVIYPITYPRNFYPLPLEQSLTVAIFKGMRSVDNPSNCLPSLHVGLCYLFAWGFFKESKLKFTLSIVASTAISLSTLTTKQHYIYDIIAGFFLATAIYMFFKLKTKVKA